MRELVQSGVLGQIVQVDHRENVSFWHMAHSYVRGNWRNREQSSPMILAKCCHDLDILPWVLGQKPNKLASVGSLMHFKPENAPEGALQRCRTVARPLRPARIMPRICIWRWYPSGTVLLTPVKVLRAGQRINIPRTRK
jgi:predicted dehydrogenase